MRLISILILACKIFLVIKSASSYNSPKVIEKYARENYRLVPYFAKGYIKKYALNKYEREELIQEGYVGLMHASRKYDDTRGLKFSTYSSYWIKRYFQEYLKKNNKRKSYTRPLILQQIPSYDYKHKIELSGLSEIEKQLIIERYYNNKKVKQLALEYGVSRNTLRAWFKKALEKLKKNN
jgi:DNA-directed RNA polymerase sigma subunit (sigma70/sigma32)